MQSSYVIGQLSLSQCQIGSSGQWAMNTWGKLSARAKRKASTKQLEFLNRNKEKFSWDKKELDLSEVKVLPEMVTPHHDVMAEMPGV